MEVSVGKQISSALSVWLDWIRALAALAVFAGHSRAFCVELDSSPAGPAGWLLKAFYFATGLGHAAVVVFFVLSGYLIGGSVLKEFRQTGGLRVGAYVVARVARIHSVLIPALVLGAAADWMGLRVLHASAVYEQGHFPRLLWWNVAESSGLGDFLANAACLQNIVAPALGSNGPLWSLSIEFWSYFLFPALLMALWPRVPWSRRCLAAVLAMALLWMLGAGKGVFFLFWLAGVGVRLVPPMRTPPVWLGLTVFVGMLVAAKAARFQRPVSADLNLDALVAAAFVVLLWSASQRAAPMPLWLAKCGQQLAGSSYTLYACHFPLATLAAAALMKIPGWTMPGGIYNPWTWVIYGGFLLVLGGACFGLSLVTERKHLQLKRWLMTFM
jgi:peptidoglycan/LPS O-acetylase OafA/YrhL